MKDKWDKARTYLREYAESFSKRISFTDEETTTRLREMFVKCFMDTIETTVMEGTADENLFLVTGDINAMWLRDSSAQVIQYIDLVGQSPDVKEMIKSLILRQFGCIVSDPYANAFMENFDCESQWKDDITDAARNVWERKFEVDSLCYPVWLLKKYIEITMDYSVFEEDRVKSGLSKIIEVFENELDHEKKSKYSFKRIGDRPSDTLERDGKGPAAAKTGLIWSGFRPSDDACQFSYHIADNYFAVGILKFLETVFEVYYEDIPKKVRSNAIRKSIEGGLAKFASVNDPVFGDILVYEADGFGNYVLMDDANVPSLLGLPVLEAINKNDSLYINTRKFILSRKNPYYYVGKLASGVGSPHTPKGNIWPIGLITEALTEPSRERQEEILLTLMNTTAQTGYMHESFDGDDDMNFTRSWFAWANSMFAYLVIKMFG